MTCSDSPAIFDVWTNVECDFGRLAAVRPGLRIFHLTQGLKCDQQDRCTSRRGLFLFLAGHVAGSDASSLTHRGTIRSEPSGSGCWQLRHSSGGPV
jgi:hypothetical protein